MNVTKQWSIDELRLQTSVVRGDVPPTMVLLNATYLNTYLKRFEKGNIWLHNDRIVYIGDEEPKKTEQTEVVDCSDRVVVPGYIEPHAHPFQIYHPQTFADYAAKRGTTTLISDNLVFYLTLPDEESFRLMELLDTLPTSFFWWCRYDPQTMINEELYTTDRIRKWLNREDVVQGGELTSWPQVLQGDDQILEWMQETRSLGKPVEGHLPGASEKTLTQMRLLGVDCDHEAMTGHEAIIRLKLGLTTSLRYSSIRPDLPVILKEMIEGGITNFDHVYMTTDGSTPLYYEKGIMDAVITIALEQGVDPVDAYLMASSNVAMHYGFQNELGMIAPGRIAHLNILNAIDQPVPTGVIAKGQWVVKDETLAYDYYKNFNLKNEWPSLTVNWTLTPDMLEPVGATGIEMVNAVITKPFPIVESEAGNYTYLTLIDKHGKWRISTYVKGFAENVSGFASSYSNTGDFLLIGKNKDDILTAFEHVKQLKGGIAIAENGDIVETLPLPVSGSLSDQPLESLIEEVRAFVKPLRDRGYDAEDPIYSLLFFSSTHLPYIRITQKGLYDVLKRTVIVESVKMTGGRD